VQRFSRQARSNIVQHVKNVIHTEFLDLVKPKTQNWPINMDDLYYTYLNLIINHSFANPNIEKNSIVFGMAIALNYLDLSKEINIVPSKVVNRMNYIFEKMNIADHEE
ncbi:2949_t:CDS:2, partial [Racocetra persica]